MLNPRTGQVPEGCQPGKDAQDSDIDRGWVEVEGQDLILGERIDLRKDSRVRLGGDRFTSEQSVEKGLGSSHRSLLLKVEPLVASKGYSDLPPPRVAWVDVDL